MALTQNMSSPVIISFQAFLDPYTFDIARIIFTYCVSNLSIMSFDQSSITAQPPSSVSSSSQRVEQAQGSSTPVLVVVDNGQRHDEALAHVGSWCPRSTALVVDNLLQESGLS